MQFVSKSWYLIQDTHNKLHTQDSGSQNPTLFSERYPIRPNEGVPPSRSITKSSDQSPSPSSQMPTPHQASSSTLFELIRMSKLNESLVNFEEVRENFVGLNLSAVGDYLYLKHKLYLSWSFPFYLMCASVSSVWTITNRSLVLYVFVGLEIQLSCM